MDPRYPLKTLRDEFAMAALTLTDKVGLDTIRMQSVVASQSPEDKAKSIAHRAYLIADAMLVERAKWEKKP